MLYGMQADMHVETTTRNFISSALVGIQNVPWLFLQLNRSKSFGSVDCARLGAFIRKSCEGPRTSRRSAIRSVAELLGAQARMRALGSLSKIWRIASIMVTVFPVPGLQEISNLHSEKESMAYGPNTTNGGLPGSKLRMAVTASLCISLSLSRRLIGLSNRISFSEGLRFLMMCASKGKRRRGGENGESSA